VKADVLKMTEGRRPDYDMAGRRPDYDMASSQGTTGVEERGMWSWG
jgi:hypothetical protein